MITILLEQDAIEEALKNYIGETTLGVDLNNMTLTMRFIPGRGKNGLRCEARLAKIEDLVEVPSVLGEKDAVLTSAAPPTEENEETDDTPALGPFD